jgi:hypothetical protein
MARRMRLVLDDPDPRAIPGEPSSVGGQTGDEAEQTQRYLLDDVRRNHPEGAVPRLSCQSRWSQ